jgi:hypothetical protein
MLQIRGSTGLFWVRKIMYFVLEAFTDILFERNQLAIFWSSQFTYVITSLRIKPLARLVVSSAKSTENIEVQRQKSFM